MQYYSYILYSEKTDKMYFGQTNSLDKRLIRHNSGEVLSSKRGIPWVLLYYSEHEERSESMKEERRWKNVKSRKKVIERMNRLQGKNKGVVENEDLLNSLEEESRK